MINETIEIVQMAMMKLMFIDVLPLITSIIALVISIVALTYTIKQFFLKKGTEVRSTYSLTYSIDCNDAYISNLILENRKDKPIVIFKIYVKVGNNNYIEIENFENNPLVIKPFEVYIKEYESLIEYNHDLIRIKIDNLLKDIQNVKTNTVLITTEGEYVVKTYVKKKEISFDKSIIKIKRLPYKDVDYGENIKYLIDFTLWNDECQIIALNKDVSRHKYSFNLTEKLMQNRLALENHIKDYIKGNKNYKSVIVIDFEQRIKNMRNNSIVSSNIVNEAINIR